MLRYHQHVSCNDLMTIILDFVLYTANDDIHRAKYMTVEFTTIDNDNDKWTKDANSDDIQWYFCKIQ